MKRVVIAGMGFGGLRVAKALASSGLEIVMVDRKNYHLFQPLLYQVATAGLEQESIAYPIRALARTWKNAHFRLGAITGIDLVGKRLLLEDEPLSYDYLVLATGSRTNFFGMKSIEEFAFDLKRLDQAEDLRNRILLLFEKASREPNPERRKALLTFVIVGGGPTGVEFAGALRELSKFVLSRDYPEVRLDDIRIVLVEAASSLLTAMPEKLRLYALERLRAMGVEVLLETKVTGADAEHVYFYGGLTINSHTLFWSAGVAASSLTSALGIPLGPAGRIRVQPDLTVEGCPGVFAIGDLAFLEQDGAPLPMMAPVATQQGRYVAEQIQALERGETCPPFRFRDKGAMATIGRSSAVATAHGYTFSGYFAWVIWLLLHLYYLIGFRNRILVLLNWAYYYFFHEQQVRLITSNRRRAQEE